MGLASNVIEILELSHAEQITRIQIPRKPSDVTIYKLFLDPSGRHLIITSTLGENWYLYRTWKKPRQLKGFKMVVTALQSAMTLSSVSASKDEEKS